ncbi:MAG: FG-GAP repeat protein [Thermoplasmatales archaeon]|nr:FG-GAP repeat protein [Thermoplasmatales archaeon]
MKKKLLGIFVCMLLIAVPVVSVAGNITKYIIVLETSNDQVNLPPVNTGDIIIDWMQQEKLIPSDGTIGDEFSYSTCIDGDYAIIGARFAEGNKDGSGAAYIFKRNGTTWYEEQKLVPSDGAGGDRFGVTVSIDNEYAVVGSFKNAVNGVRKGAVYVYKRYGTTWVEEQKLVASDGGAGDKFGSGIQIDEDYIVVGSHVHDYNEHDIGAAYVFKRNGSTWHEQQKLLASDGQEEDEFGGSVSLDGDYIVIGAAMDEKSGANHGASYVFKRDGTNWIEEQKLTASDGENNDLFGGSVSIDGDYIVIGAYMDDKSAPNKGAAYVFKRDGTNWIEEQKLTASDGESGDDFGVRVSIDEKIIAIGAWKDVHNGSRSGSAYIFERDGTTWVEEQKLVASDAASGDWFGHSLILDGNYMIIGAPGDESHTGSAYIFTIPIIEVSIDIKPGSYPNSINPSSNGKLPVAILTTDDFNTIDVDPDTVVFLGANPLKWADEDVDDDGDIDKIFHFKTRELNFSMLELIENETWATLSGYTFDQEYFEGKDTVRLVKGIIQLILLNVIERIINRFPNAFPILRHILGL